jgi:hypothetical protein
MSSIDWATPAGAGAADWGGFSPPREAPLLAGGAPSLGASAAAAAGPACHDPRWPAAPHDDAHPLYASDDFRIHGFKVRGRGRGRRGVGGREGAEGQCMQPPPISLTPPPRSFSLSLLSLRSSPAPRPTSTTTRPAPLRIRVSGRFGEAPPGRGGRAGAPPRPGRGGWRDRNACGVPRRSCPHDFFWFSSHLPAPPPPLSRRESPAPGPPVRHLHRYRLPRHEKGEGVDEGAVGRGRARSRRAHARFSRAPHAQPEAPSERPPRHSHRRPPPPVLIITSSSPPTPFPDRPLPPGRPVLRLPLRL